MVHNILDKQTRLLQLIDRAVYATPEGKIKKKSFRRELNNHVTQSFQQKKITPNSSEKKKIEMLNHIFIKLGF